jgi:hypothetical protein
MERPATKYIQKLPSFAEKIDEIGEKCEGGEYAVGLPGSFWNSFT